MFFLLIFMYGLLELHEGHDRSKDFILGYQHTLLFQKIECCYRGRVELHSQNASLVVELYLDICEDCGFNVEPFLTAGLSSCQYGGSLSFPMIDVSENFLKLLLVDLHQSKRNP